MTIGEKLKKAVEESGYSTETVALQIGMSYNNLYRLYKKESFEIKYLVQIASFLGVPLGYFLNDETIGAITQGGSGNQLQQATNVGKNQQQISVGIDDCPQRLEALQREYALLEKSVADKERIIELLSRPTNH